MATVRSRSFALDDTLEAIEHYFEKGYTDGLPIVPPTERNVGQMLTATARNPSDVVATIPPVYGEATVEKIAINAVMAGCRPEYLPVVIAGVEAMVEERFNLHGIQGTTHFATPLFIVNGPIRHRLHINSGHNVFGQGARANATIGRALHLIMWNIGGAKPDEIDKTTLGNPGRFSYLIGENEEQTPWEPLHVERGFQPEESTITVYAAEGLHGISDHASNTAGRLVATLGHSLSCVVNHKAYLLGQNLLVIGPEHAKTFAEEGWSKAQVRQWIFENVRRPVQACLPDDSGGEGTPAKLLELYPDPATNQTLIPKFRSPEMLVIVVAGGTAGRFSACIPGWIGYGIGSEMVSKRIET